MFSLTKIETSELETDEFHLTQDASDDDDNINISTNINIGAFNLVTVVDFSQIKVDIDFDIKFKTTDLNDKHLSSSTSFERNLATLLNTCMEMIENQIPINVEINSNNVILKDIQKTSNDKSTIYQKCF